MVRSSSAPPNPSQGSSSGDSDPLGRPVLVASAVEASVKGAAALMDEEDGGVCFVGEMGRNFITPLLSPSVF